MPRPGRGNPEETRARIVAAASDLFYAQGVRAVGVDLIAAEADVTKRTLYKHFATKAELVAAYLEARDEAVLSGLIRTITEVDSDPAEQVERLFCRLAESSSNPHWHGCPFARIVGELRDPIDREIVEIAARHKRVFKDWLADYFSARDVRQPDVVARQILILVDGAITELLIHRDADYALAAGQAARKLIEAAQS